MNLNLNRYNYLKWILPKLESAIVPPSRRDHPKIKLLIKVNSNQTYKLSQKVVSVSAICEASAALRAAVCCTPSHSNSFQWQAKTRTVTAKSGFQQQPPASRAIPNACWSTSGKQQNLRRQPLAYSRSRCGTQAKSSLRAQITFQAFWITPKASKSHHSKPRSSDSTGSSNWKSISIGMLVQAPTLKMRALLNPHFNAKWTNLSISMDDQSWSRSRIRRNASSPLQTWWQ